MSLNFDCKKQRETAEGSVLQKGAQLSREYARTIALFGHRMHSSKFYAGDTYKQLVVVC
jgi:hypothetical protein